jgi:HEPN domain-containing protein
MALVTETMFPRTTAIVFSSTEHPAARLARDLPLGAIGKKTGKKSISLAVFLYFKIMEKPGLDIGKQIQYWKITAESDLETALLLIDNKKTIQGLFFCHLAIEKIIKAHVVRCTKDLPDRIHNLTRLAGKTDLVFTESEKELLGILMIYQLEGRYPENYPATPSPGAADKYLKRTRDLMQCLAKKL